MAAHPWNMPYRNRRITMVSFINAALQREMQARMVNFPVCDGVGYLRIVPGVLAGL